MSAAGWLESAIQDIRHAVRSLRGAPTFTAVALITLAEDSQVLPVLQVLSVPPTRPQAATVDLARARAVNLGSDGGLKVQVLKVLRIAKCE